MSQTSVSSTRNATFASGNTLGRVFWGTKSPCGNGGTHSLGFPHKISVFSYGKTQGRVFGGIKSPCGNGHTHSLVLGKDRSRTRCLRGASSACQPTGQSDDGGPFGQGIPRSDPAFSSFFDTIFNNGKTSFLTHDGAPGVKMGGNESYGRGASF